jgi:hypothetical protein
MHAYRQELEQVDAAHESERKAQLAACADEMAALFNKRSAAEAEFTERHLATVEGYQRTLLDLQIADAQEFNSLKVLYTRMMRATFRAP